MKILYAVQGTGNGHLARASELIPYLEQKGEVDILLSGRQSNLKLPFPVKYRLQGLSFSFGKKGGIDLWDTFRQSNFRQLWKEIRNFPIEQYDLVINDFEPVSAWAARLRNVACVALSHQAAVIHSETPKSTKMGWIGKIILQHYAPTIIQYGFHFKAYDDHIFTPVIRREIRQQVVKNQGHYTVYLPAYGDQEIVKVLSTIKTVKWEIFQKIVNIFFVRII